VKNLLGKSLRGRLTILYGLLLTLALALYAGGTSVYFLHNLRHQLDLSLDRDIETVEELLSLAPDGHLEIGSEEGEAREADLDRGYLLEVWSANGALLYRSNELNGAAMGQPVHLNGSRWREVRNSTWNSSFRGSQELIQGTLILETVLYGCAVLCLHPHELGARAYLRARTVSARS
jgi:hypothetical protein